MAEFYRSLFALKARDLLSVERRVGRGWSTCATRRANRVLSFVADASEPGFLRAESLPTEQKVTFGPGPHLGRWREHFTGAALSVGDETALTMTVEPWGYRVFVG